MIMYADPSVQKIERALSSGEYGHGVVYKDRKTVVAKYLEQCKRRRERERNICPACMEIVIDEVDRLGWGDECLMEFITKMFSGADISQLESFYRRYSRTKSKTTFFLNFVRNEL